jgi:hypothetical protein
MKLKLGERHEDQKSSAQRAQASPYVHVSHGVGDCSIGDNVRSSSPDDGLKQLDVDRYRVGDGDCREAHDVASENARGDYRANREDNRE